MKLEIHSQARGNSFCIRNLKEGNELTSTMKSGELVVNDVCIPFVLQRIYYGRISDWLDEKNQTDIQVIIFDQLRPTLFTKNGYVSVQLGTRMGLIYVYIKRSYSKTFSLQSAWLHCNKHQTMKRRIKMTTKEQLKKMLTDRGMFV